MLNWNCGWCGHAGVHATTLARGSRPTSCTGCAVCRREQERGDGK
jgi:hypothetical protein